MSTRTWLCWLLMAILLGGSGMALANIGPLPAGTTAAVAQLAESHFSNDFGQKVIDWIAHGSDDPTWGDKSLLSVVALTLNAIALAMMAWLAVIGGASYVFQTANKGVPGGQVISSFWAPIRISTATIMLIPLSSGFSTLQYGIITVAEKGNAHGSYLMEQGLDYLYDFGAYRAPGIPDGRALLFSLVESEVCLQYINSYTGRDTISTVSTGPVRQGDRLVSKLAYRYNESPNTFTANDPRVDYCGAVAFSIEHKEADKLYKKTYIDADELTAAYGGPPKIAAGQMALIERMQPLAADIAAMLLSDEQALRDLQAQGAAAQSTYEKAAAEVRQRISEAALKVQTAINTYNQESQQLIAQVVSNLNDEKNSARQSSGWREQTKEMGWPALGTIFWQINVSQSEINKLAASFEASYTAPSPDGDWLADERFVEISTRIHGLATQYATAAKNAAPAARQGSNQPGSVPSLSAIANAGAEGDGWVDSLKSGIYDFLAGNIRYLMYKNGPDDLMINMQYFGSAMSTLAETAWWGKSFAINMASSLLQTGGEALNKLSNKVAWIPGAGWLAKTGGVAAEATGKGFAMTLADISSMLNYVIVALVMVGFTLGVVLPTIPLAQWLMGVISWMLFFIECLLVSPMWMAAHGTAEKDGWGSEHTRQGYMLMIGLYLNPILRVAGFFAIFLALKPIGWMVAWFFDYVQGVVVSGFALIFVFLGSIVISAIFAYTAMVRVFGLPSELFERGLRWINGGQEVTGDSQSEKETRGNIAAFVSKSENAPMSGRRDKPSIGTPMPSATPSAGGGGGGGSPGGSTP